VNLPWDAACGDAIGAAWLRDAIAPGGPLGRAARERTFGPGEEAPARAALERAGRAASAIDPGLIAALRAVLAAAPDPTAALVRVRGGGVLGDVELFALSRFLDACAEVRGLASGTELDAGDAGDAGEVSARPNAVANVLSRRCVRRGARRRTGRGGERARRLRSGMRPPRGARCDLRGDRARARRRVRAHARCDRAAASPGDPRAARE
jgi:hypothetical protein